jgi:hypothetical protein
MRHEPKHIVASSSGEGIEVLQNDGNGSFTMTDLGIPEFGDGYGYEVVYAAGDLNNDGNLDIVAANSNSTDNLLVFLSDSTGRLTAQPPQFLDGEYPSAIVLADVDEDLKLDLIMASASNRTVSISLGDGQGGFTSASSPIDLGGESPNALALGDVEHDDKVDIVVANESGSVSVLVGDGQGDFALDSTETVLTIANFVAVADVDGDGSENIVVVDAQDERILVLP